MYDASIIVCIYLNDRLSTLDISTDKPVKLHVTYIYLEMAASELRSSPFKIAEWCFVPKHLPQQQITIPHVRDLRKIVAKTCNSS